MSTSWPCMLAKLYSLFRNVGRNSHPHSWLHINSSFSMSMMELVRTPVSMLRTQWRPSRPYCWKVSLETSAILQVTFSTLIHVGINHGSVEVMLKILRTYYMRNMVQSTNLWLCTVIEHIRASYIGAFHAFKNTNIPSTDYFTHPRFENVFLQRFATYCKTKIIQSLHDKARESMSHTCAKEIRQIAELKTASRGLKI